MKFNFDVLKNKYTNSEVLKVVLHCTYKKCTLLKVYCKLEVHLSIILLKLYLECT